MLWEYLGAGSSTTKLLLHLNWNANDSSGNWNNLTPTNIIWTNWIIWNWSANCNTNSFLSINSALWIDWWNITVMLKLKINTQITSWFSDIFDNWNTNTKTLYVIDYDYNWWTRRLRFHRVKNGVIDNFFTYNITLIPWKIYTIWLKYNWSNLYWYVNWVLVWNIVASGNWTSNFTSRTYINWAWNWIWNQCLFDEVIIENRVWTDNEIKKYYTYSQWKFIL